MTSRRRLIKLEFHFSLIFFSECVIVVDLFRFVEVSKEGTWFVMVRRTFDLRSRILRLLALS